MEFLVHYRLIAGIIVCLCSLAAYAEDPAERAADDITADYMRGIVVEISSDAYGGRGPGTKGDAMTRDYLARQLAALGLQPGAGNGQWQQKFDLVGVKSEQQPSWDFASGDKRVELKQREQFVAFSGKQVPQVSLDDAELVFVGYGIQAPEFGWDDYKGADLKGKVLVMMNNDPDWDPALFGGETRLWYGRWDYKYLSAARQGAAGAIIIHTTPSAGYPFSVVQTSWANAQYELPAGDEPRIEVKAWVTEDAARELVGMAGFDLDKLREQARSRDFRPVPLGIHTSLSMEVALHRIETGNVIGLIPGSDPELKDEAVIFSAHHDHLGIGEPDESGDNIYNGARDNAAGVAQVMAIARAMKALPTAPRRSVVIALVAAEEQGLLGSKWYAEHPTFAPGKIAVDINYDGGNIWGRSRDVTLVGLGKSSVDEVALAVAKRQGRVVKPDQFPSRGYYYRSDQFSFARIGVPGMYPKSGTDMVGKPPGWGREQIDHYTAVDYHKPGDEYSDAWDFDGLIDNAQLGYWTGLEVANADAMPQWKPGDEFAEARKAALDAAAE